MLAYVCSPRPEVARLHALKFGVTEARELLHQQVRTG